MSSYQTTEKSSVYLEALRAVEGIEPPAIGFISPGTTSATVGFGRIIKQNNLLIQLLVRAVEQTQEVREELTTVRQSLRSLLEKERDAKALDEVVSRLENLKIKGAEDQPVTKTVTPFYVYQDPRKIFIKEQEKLGIKPKSSGESSTSR